VSRYLYSLYLDRPDLHVHFPDIFGGDAARFNDWVWADGAKQDKIPVELLPQRAEIETRAPAAVADGGADLPEGINVAGYFRAELGIGEAARQLTSAIESAGIPFSTTTYDVTLSRQAHPFVGRGEGVAYDINVLCVNADSTPRFARDVGAGFFERRHTVGYWFWEVEQFPETMRPAFEIVDEVWTATDFIAGAVRAANARPVFTVPLPVPVPDYSPAITRARLGLPDRFTFLFVFDFLSIVERKNPYGLIDAFTRAFAPDEGPVLVIKSINGELRLAELERLRAAVGNRLDVWIVDTYYTQEEKNALLGSCDCYVSLHRSEGLGLTMAEAMALGKPVVATGYSGNLHFMTPENSYLVDYTRTLVPSGCDPYPTTTSWADPDVGQAASFMREVYERPELAAARARAGQHDILERHNRQTSARAVAARVEAIRRERRSRVVGLPGASATATTGPLVGPPAPVGIEQLETVLGPLAETSTLRLSAEGRSLGALRLAAQRALFRVLRPLWFQQHQFHAQVVAALRLTAGALRTEQQARETVDRRVRELTRKLQSTRRELQRLKQESFDGDGPHTAQLAASLGELQRESEGFRARTGEHLEALTAAAQHAQGGLAELSQRLYAVPYMADPARFEVRDSQGRRRLGYQHQPGRPPEAFYRGFEDTFRGSEALIRDRQRGYLPLFTGRTGVVDLGCGRGEMLDLLSEAGIPARGVDLDPDMVRRCREKGHAVEEMGALQFLRAEPPHSIPAIFSAQVIEHLTFDELKELLRLCRNRLKPGGLLVAETVNPHSIEAFKTFYTDLTHQRPIFPEVALSLVELAGFETAHVLFPLGSGDLDRDRRTQGEYAVVATIAS
jgi:glycosyltransferase involved in cell wall biosynthesis/SAM-dependent methyltransferase